jgi:DNA-binding response OmpR family regulator
LKEKAVTMKNKGAVLIVDDDAGLQTVLSHYLEEDGYRVESALTLSDAAAKAEGAAFDVLLLDLVLPDGEGTELIARLRGKSHSALIVVSGKDDPMEKIICLEMGADDYLTKPFEMRELSARIKAVLRRSHAPANEPAGTPEDAEIRFDGWCLDRRQLQLFDPQGQTANLTTGEFRLLEALALAPGRVLSREYLFDATRGGDYDAFDRAIDIQIARIRKKLGEGDTIKTVRGAGYMFTPRRAG